MINIKTALLGIVTGLANGLFGSGGGTVIVPGMQKFLHIEQHKSHATAIAVILPLTIISAMIYFNGVKADYYMIFWVSAGGVFGGYIGAKLLNKLSGGMLHKIFGLCMIAAAVRMII
ncbi:MAG: sulfite exporter TauE/SafE family protein [Clostridiales bacterium]|jgi:uncharacterized membrane protein YfcA|nr:sulfite exporter TauE/SafE family protein [Clostridiales bacterium]